MPDATMPEAMSCPQCGVRNAAGASFCSACGASTIAHAQCPSCTSLNPLGNQFCNRCGGALEHAGWAGDVATGLELASQQRFDLLISDLRLPDGSGHDLLRELRSQGLRLPAIAMSGYGQEEDIRRSYEAGFAAHLTKPGSPEALAEAIALVVGCGPPTTNGS